ncbi:hypothetical protein B0J11DRAFT_509164 [Dendryphion nanum]|uniref:Uncharacterized protein n=1 Tax=Dendryphion nanum TaxID=256645 RepID=A0A9P9IGS3_9PLEO|nr:hypothetical protein B0J11DRAFT_509164 [Dendryphion nanum]
MKVAAVSTLLFATLVLASPAPAPIAKPDAVAAPAPVAEPKFLEVDSAVAAREAAPEPDFETLAAGLQLDSRAPKKGKGSKGSSGGNDSSSAVTLSASRILELGALGLGVIEVVRLWG